MANIKLFVCCHQPAPVPEHPLLVPIQVGAALADTHFPGFFHDDTGHHISQKNRSYCELTAQYWAWKQVQADYYGFFHYRRYLYPDVHARRPYRIEGEPSLSLLDELGYHQLPQLIQGYDVIVPMGENMYIPVREHYANAPFHHEKDLALTQQIVRELYPEMAAGLEGYLSGTICYFGNIYVMRGPLFFHYCAWLFSILEEFDRRAEVAHYGPQESRVNGYLAERLLGVYLTHMRLAGNTSILELPRVHFISEAGTRQKQKFLGAILPPGTRRRSWVKGAKGGRN